MAINFLDEVYTQLEQLDLVSSRKEFCEQWLGRAEGYVRTLRFYRYQPSVDKNYFHVLLTSYADNLNSGVSWKTLL
jgi:hypothetical protein